MAVIDAIDYARSVITILAKPKTQYVRFAKQPLFTG